MGTCNKRDKKRDGEKEKKEKEREREKKRQRRRFGEKSAGRGGLGNKLERGLSDFLIFSFFRKYVPN